MREGGCLPAAGFQQTVSDLKRGHAEVCDPDVVLLVQQQVLRLQISVAERSTDETEMKPETLDKPLGAPTSALRRDERLGQSACVSSFHTTHSAGTYGCINVH